MRRKKPAKVRKPMPPPSKRHKDKRDKSYRGELDKLYNDYLANPDNWRPYR